MRKPRIFLTGATGTIGKAILNQIDHSKFLITLAVRNIEKAKKEFGRKTLSYVQFDFEQQTGFNAIDNHDIIFLLRPPQIGDVKKYIEPFLNRIAEKSDAITVFLSVQGADKKSYLPHSKIEKMIIDKGIPHVFLRPSYFMDNLTTTLFDEMEKNRRIFLPSGSLKLNWIDTSDIASICIRVFENTTQFANKVLTLTNTVNQDFSEIVNIINTRCTTRIRYESPNIFAYFVYMRRKKYSIGYIGIMLLLHFLPRFEKEPEIHTDIVKILNRNPIQVSQFVENNREKFEMIGK